MIDICRILGNKCRNSINVFRVQVNMYTCTKWRCRTPGCRHINEGYNIQKCQSCKASKASGESLQTLPGDWDCLNCKASNFQRRVVCFNCSSPRYESGNSGTAGSTTRSRRRGPESSSSGGDGKLWSSYGRAARNFVIW